MSSQDLILEQHLPVSVHMWFRMSDRKTCMLFGEASFTPKTETDQFFQGSILLLPQQLILSPDSIGMSPDGILTSDWHTKNEVLKMGQR